MLYVDSDVITTADLMSQDSDADSVTTSQEGTIPLEGDNSIIRKTVEACGEEIKSKFQNFSGYLLSPAMNVNHVAAVMNIGSTAINRARFSLNQVLISEPEPTRTQMKNWLVYEALYRLYRNASARYLGKGGDRYEKRMDLYGDERNAAWMKVISQGIPIVLIPLPCPGALRVFNAGSWTSSNVTAGGSGSTETGLAYVVAITWVGAGYVSSSARGNSESAGSAQIPIQTAAAQKISVSIATLNPPSTTGPATGTADAIYTQMAATGWNVYVGRPGQPLYKQNATPLTVATLSYTLADAPVLSGATLQEGQFSDYLFAFSGGMIWRA